MKITFKGEGKILNPQLLILKGKTTKEYTIKKSVHFAVIDKDVPANYPVNFVCVLPQHMNAASAEFSMFAKIFRENRTELAKTLLMRALESEEDPQVQKEIKKRLSQIEPKPLFR